MRAPLAVTDGDRPSIGITLQGERRSSSREPEPQHRRAAIKTCSGEHARPLRADTRQGAICLDGSLQRRKSAQPSASEVQLARLQHRSKRWTDRYRWETDRRVLPKAHVLSDNRVNECALVSQRDRRKLDTRCVLALMPRCSRTFARVGLAHQRATGTSRTSLDERGRCLL